MLLVDLGNLLKKKWLKKSPQQHSEIDSNQAFGDYGERLVLDYLLQQGFTLLAKNYWQRCGEIDIIAQRKELIVFVEVKLRNNRYFNNSEVIVLSKIKKIIRTARYYIAAHHLNNHIFRFDVALVERIGDAFELNYIERAFAESDYYE